MVQQPAHMPFEHATALLLEQFQSLQTRLDILQFPSVVEPSVAASSVVEFEESSVVASSVVVSSSPEAEAG